MLRRPWRGLAKLLCSPVARRLGASRLFGYVAARTLFYDSIVRDGIRQGASQIVVIGAGFDTRSLRLASDGVTFYEADRAQSQQKKHAALARAGLRPPVFICADLNRDHLDEHLLAAGLTQTTPTVFICEGVTMYLTRPATGDLLESLARIASPSDRLGIDFALDEHVTGGRGRPIEWLIAGATWLTTTALGEPVTLRLEPAEVVPFLQDHGWAAHTTMDVHELCARYLPTGAGRTPPPGSWVSLNQCAPRP